MRQGTQTTFVRFVIFVAAFAFFWCERRPSDQCAGGSVTGSERIKKREITDGSRGEVRVVAKKSTGCHARER